MIVTNFKKKGSVFQLAEFFTKWQNDRNLAKIDVDEIMFPTNRKFLELNKPYLQQPGVTPSQVNWSEFRKSASLSRNNTCRNRWVSRG